MSPSLLAISYFFHLIATVIWIGGLITLSLLVIPEARRVLKEAPPLNNLLLRWRKRFTPYSNLSLVVLIVTGMLQMSSDENYDGLMTFDNEWSRILLLKHIAIIGMIVAGLVLQYALAPALERASLLLERGKADAAELEALHRRERRLTAVNVALGVLVLGFSAWLTAL